MEDKERRATEEENGILQKGKMENKTKFSTRMNSIN